ncbi:MAG: hypothetical protein ACRDJ4_12395 [Actinomycetota bacterium]
MPWTKRIVAVVAIGIPVALPLAAWAQTPSPGKPVIEASRQLTDDPNPVRGHATPVVAVDPNDARVIAVGEGDGYSGTCALHVSTDGGSSWVTRVIPQPDEWPTCIEANFGPILALGFASDGTLHYVFSGANPKTYQSRLFDARSTDLGRTWDTTTIPWVEPNLDQGQFGSDALPSLAIDPNNPRRLAVGWMTNNATWNVSSDLLKGKRYYYDVFSRPYVSVSTDGGKTFGEPVDVAEGYPEDPAKIRGWMNEPHLAIGTKGEIFAFYGENMRPLPEGSTDPAPPAHLWVSVSKDGGKKYSREAVYTRASKKRDWLGQPSPAVDPESGNVYVVWDDQTEGPARVVLSRSTDAGKTWSKPQKLNDVDAQRDWNFCEFCPSISVAPGGRVDVAWYDWRNDTAFDPAAEEKKNVFQEVYYTYSTDGGKTWAANVRVNDRAIDRRLGVFDTYGLRGNIGLASTKGAALVAWDEPRNANEDTQSQDVYFARVRFGAEPATVVQSRSGWLWAIIGAGAALAVGGLILLLAGRSAGRGGAPLPSPGT